MRGRPVRERCVAASLATASPAAPAPAALRLHLGAALIGRLLLLWLRLPPTAPSRPASSPSAIRRPVALLPIFLRTLLLPMRLASLGDAQLVRQLAELGSVPRREVLL